jgi:hypothetical protein
MKIVNRRREQSDEQNRMELYATARMLDSCAAQLAMLAEDDCIEETEHDEIADLGHAARRVAEDMFERAGHA